MFGGFGSTTPGFGQPAQPNQPTTSLFGQPAAPAATPGFGGFGTPAPGAAQPSAFGQPAAPSAFGQPAPAAGTSAFGTSTPSAFGQNKPAFGTGTSLFGGNSTPASGFGSFGSTASTSTPAFGGAAQTGGLFGQKPAASGGLFGSNTLGGTTGTNTSVFGATQPTTSAFGATNTSGGMFGSGLGAQKPAGFGGMGGDNKGTGNPPFAPFHDKDTSLPNATVSIFQSVTAMPAYRNFSFEELRLQDYALGKKFATGAGGAFGQVGGFGATNTTGGFGTFGQPATSTTSTPLFGSTFGANQPQQQTTGFGFGQQPQQTGGLFGQQPATTAPSLFGSTSTPAFGTSTTTPAFGSTPTSGFTFGQPQQQGQQSQPKTGFGGFGGFGTTTTTPAPAFGQQPATTTPGGGLFGAKPATTQTGFGTFGAPAATTTPSLFGQAATSQPAAAGGLFGSTTATPFGQKPAGSTFGFGQTTSAPSLFGSTPAPAPTGGLFGQTPAQQPQATGLFGQTTAAPTTGLFGTGTTGGFGTAPGLGGTTAATGTGFGSGTSLFGQKPATGGFGGFGPAPTAGAAPGTGFTLGQTANTGTGLFGSSTTGFGTSLGGFGAGASTAAPGGTTSLFGTSTLGAQRQPSLQASIDKNPYGTNPLFNLPPGAKPPTGPGGAPGQEPALIPLLPSEKKKPALTPHFKVTPRSASKLKLRGFTPSPLTKPGTAVGGAAGTPDSGKRLGLFDGTPKDEQILGLDPRFQPRRSVKKLVLEEHRASTTPPGSAPNSVSKGKGTIDPASARAKMRVTFDPSLEDEAAAEVGAPAVDVVGEVEDVATADQSILSSPSISILKTPTAANRVANGSMLVASTPSPGTGTSQQTRGSASGTKRTTPAKSPTSAKKSPARSTDYETIPTMQELISMTDDELRNVEDFSVTLPGVGTVKFLETVDLLAASPTGDRTGLPQIPGKVIIFQPKVLTVYPDETKKPPVGMGVNVPAEVYLEGCWPIDKATRKPILDPSDPRYDRHLQKLEEMPETQYIGFHPSTGTWRFRVEHFSRYGLMEDDEEEGQAGHAAAGRGAASTGRPQYNLEEGSTEEELDEYDEDIVEEEIDEEEIYEDDEDDEDATYIEQDSFANVRQARVALPARRVRDLREAVNVADDEDAEEVDEEEPVESSEEVDTEEIGVAMVAADEDEEMAAADEDGEEGDESVQLRQNQQQQGRPLVRSPPEVNRMGLARKVQVMKASLFSGTALRQGSAAAAGGYPSASRNIAIGVGTQPQPLRTFQYRSSAAEQDFAPSSPLRTVGDKRRRADLSSGSEGEEGASFGRPQFQQQQQQKGKLRAFEQTVPEIDDHLEAGSLSETETSKSKGAKDSAPAGVGVGVATKPLGVSMTMAAIKTTPGAAVANPEVLAHVPPLEKSVLYGKQEQFVDAGLMMGRRFRGGGGRGGVFATAGRFNNPSPKDKENKSQQSSTLKFSVVSLRKVKVFGTDAASDADGDAANRIALEKQRHHVTLQVALDNSRVVLTRGTTGVDGTIEEEEDHEEDDDEDVVIVDADGGDVNKRRSKSRGVKGGQGEKKEGEASGVPTAHVSPDLKFERLVDAALGVNVMGTDNALAAATDKVFGDHELQIWKLCAALWDPLYLPDSAGAGDGRDTSRQAAGAILAALRKEEVSRWLKEAVKKDVEAEVGESVASGSVGGASAAAKVLFGLLTGRQIGRAVGESIKSRNLRLATILSQLGGAGARVVTNRTGVQRLVGGSPVEAASGHGVPGRGGTDEDVRKHIVEQVRLWREAAAKVSTTSIGGAGGINAQAPISALMSEDLFASWLLCAGEVQDWLKEVFPRVTDWKRTWGLFLWYGEGGWWDLKESVEKYEAWVKKMKNLGGVVRPPLPHYIEKRLRRLRGASGVESDAADCLFHLLKLYTNERYLLERVCRPAAVGPDPLDVRVPWLLWLLLSKVKRVKEFKDAKVKVVEVSRVVDGGVDDDDDTPMFGASRKSAFGRSTMTIVSITQGKEVTTSETLTELQPTSSLTADALTSSLVFQLEALGLWTWACFVGMHLGTASGREAAVKELLSRWYPLEDASGSCWKGVAVGNKDDGNAMAVDRQDAGGESEEWRFLIGQLRIPQQWVFEAKVVRARYEGDVIQEAAALIDCEAFALAHKSIVLRVAPSAIINGDFEYLEALLTHLPDWLDTWDLAGGLIKQYIHIAKHVPKLLDTADEPLLNPRSRSNSVRIGSSTATMSVEEDIVKDAKSTLRGHWIDRLRDVLERLAEVKKRGGFEAIFRVGLLDGWGDAAMEGVGAREEQQGGQEQPRKRNRGGFANSPRVCLAEMTGRTAMLLGEIERVCQDDHDDLEAAAEKDGELLMELALPEDQRLARLHRLSEDWFSVALSVAVRGVKSY